MNTKMTHTARAELADAVRRRYQSATGKEKRGILDEFVATTGYHVKSAIRVLNGQPDHKYRQTRVRLSLYDEAARAALIVLWEASDRVCGKRLQALLPILLPALERNRHLKLDVSSSVTGRRCFSAWKRNQIGPLWSSSSSSKHAIRKSTVSGTSVHYTGG